MRRNSAAQWTVTLEVIHKAELLAGRAEGTKKADKRETKIIVLDDEVSRGLIEGLSPAEQPKSDLFADIETLGNQAVDRLKIKI